MMADILKYNLYDCFQHSKLQGFYLVGSRSLYEENAYSDFDLFGLSEDGLSSEKVSNLRQDIKNQLKDIIPTDKIGFRIRAIQELPLFQSKLKSWGYDILNSQHIY